MCELEHWEHGVLPCPFCGESAQFIMDSPTFIDDAYGLEAVFRIGCEACGAMGPEYRVYNGDDAEARIKPTKGEVEIIINYWNQRKSKKRGG